MREANGKYAARENSDPVRDCAKRDQIWTRVKEILESFYVGGQSGTLRLHSRWDAPESDTIGQSTVTLGSVLACLSHATPPHALCREPAGILSWILAATP